jgi:hypothetical protein
MPLELFSDLPAQHYIPWSFLFATALLATGVDAFSRRLFNPVTVSVWFFGVAFAAAVGAWGLPQISAALICLSVPHVLISLYATRAQARRAEPQAHAADQTGEPEHRPDAATPENPPIRLVPAEEPDESGLRRVA